MSLLTLRNLQVRFGDDPQAAPVVDGLDLDVQAGELVGIVGESGSGKSVTMMAVMGLLDGTARVTADQLRFDGRDLLTMSARERRRIIGREIAMIFQDPQTSLNPSYTVGDQLAEPLQLHLGLKGRALRERLLQLLAQVEIPDPEARLRAYPHELSGGMSQRVMIAMALACEPKLLIADEPTTALDVTVQAQIVQLLQRLQRERGMGLVMITHDLAVVASAAQRIGVMYAGQLVETAQADRLFDAPAHPYTAALLAAIPEHHPGARRLQALRGIVPGRHDRPQGCLFAPRCDRVAARCRSERPLLKDHGDSAVRCYFPLTPAIAQVA